MRPMRIAAAVCGSALDDAARILDLDREARPQLVLVDLRDPDAAVAAAAYPATLPRVAVVTAEQRDLLAATGATVPTAVSTDPAVLGPLIAAVAPRSSRGATRVIVVTSGRGGVGRTLLVANLARRLAATRSVLAVDLTGSGALAWWLGVSARPWLDIAPLTDELRAEHVGLLAVEAASRLSVIGGPSEAPTPALASVSLVAARDLVDIVLVDAPPLADPVARAAVAVADRVLVPTYDDAASRAILDAAAVPEAAWRIGAQGPVEHAFRVLPRDERSIADAMANRERSRGALGAAYDELTELLAIDAS